MVWNCWESTPQTACKEYTKTMEEPEKPKRKLHPRDTDDVVREQVGGFLRFMHEYAVVGLAIGFIIGQQAQLVVKQLVDSFVTPLLNVFIGQSLQSKAFTISFSGNHASVTWGKFA